MASLKHLLVVVDFTEISEHALLEAISLAKDTGARITVMHVFAMPIYRFADSEYVPTSEEATRASTAAQKAIDALVARHASSGVPMATVIHSGPVAEEVVAEATRLGANMIVMGTHGRGMIGTALLGSVAQNVIRSATVPVLTVRGTKTA